jgi:SAM-dependent methyltransferase
MDLEAIRGRSWFYEFDLPDGSRTASYLPEGVAAIHTTRLAMLWQALDPLVKGEWGRFSAVDLACHQGYFASHLARRGCRDVLAIDTREGHLADTRLIAQAYGLTRLRTARHDLEDVRPAEIGETFDFTLMLGLLYHVENPMRLLRLARALTRVACVIETQVVPNMTGVVDWGSWRFQRPMLASLGLIDESAETHGPEASAYGLCLTPSHEALLLMLRHAGFPRVERVAVPPEGYEQLVSGKRIMVVGYTQV